MKSFYFYLKIVIIFVFFILNFQNISAFYQQNINENLAEDTADKYNSHAASIEDKYAKALDSLGLRLYPGTSFNSESRSTERSLNHCKALVFQTLKSLPEEHGNQLKHLTLYFADGRRGLGGGSTVILRCSDVGDEELMSVLVHEMGHLVDTGLKTGHQNKGRSEFMDGNLPIYNDDISLKFYRISWQNEKVKKYDSLRSDFVTGYAMTDPFEDFAETYNFYLLHGNQFRKMADFNRNIERKYLFMKYYIFKGLEFDNDPETETRPFTRDFDSTKLAYDKERFLSSAEYAKDRIISLL